MKYLAEIDVMPLKELLDPQGKTVGKSMTNLNLQGIEDVRIGKHIKITLDATSEAEAREKVDTACRKLLANPVMESFSFTLASVES